MHCVVLLLLCCSIVALGGAAVAAFGLPVCALVTFGLFVYANDRFENLK